jgi:gamma-polyglutamate synthase
LSILGIPLLLLLVLTLFLLAENSIVSRRRSAIPLRITVSGTRGKTGIARDLAAVLRKSGLNVLAKTTGSEPRYILPDGSEEPVARRGLVSILEQKRVIARAALMGVDCLVVEIMSIHPDNHKAESQRLIKPHITVLTNFRADHLDVSDGSAFETESVYLNDVHSGSVVFIHSNHSSQHLKDEIAKRSATLTIAEPAISNSLTINRSETNFRIGENLDLVISVARHLQLSDSDIVSGIESARHDAGRPELFLLKKGEKSVWFANTFAANDPESTSILSDVIIAQSGLMYSGKAGLLSLRSDRAERTEQWLEYLKGEGKSRFNQVFVTGSHKGLVKRLLPESCILKPGSPEAITNYIIDNSPDKTVIFGLANIAGLGSDLVDYWRDVAQGRTDDSRYR